MHQDIYIYIQSEYLMWISALVGVLTNNEATSSFEVQNKRFHAL